MQQGIHPKYGPATAKCACGYEFETQATVSLIKVDICSSCHPFYTGQQKLVDSAGRVERFGKRFSKTGGKTIARQRQKQKRISKAPPKPKGKVLSSAPKSKTKKKKAH